VQPLTTGSDAVVPAVDLDGDPVTWGVHGERDIHPEVVWAVPPDEGRVHRQGAALRDPVEK